MIAAGAKLWAAHKEWSAKKKIAVYILAPVSIVAVALTIKFGGWDTAVLAVQLITETLEAFATVEM
jgi:hypothetical protein